MCNCGWRSMAPHCAGARHPCRRFLASLVSDASALARENSTTEVCSTQLRQMYMRAFPHAHVLQGRGPLLHRCTNAAPLLTHASLLVSPSLTWVRQRPSGPSLAVSACWTSFCSWVDMGSAHVASQLTPRYTAHHVRHPEIRLQSARKRTPQQEQDVSTAAHHHRTVKPSTNRRCSEQSMVGVLACWGVHIPCKVAGTQ